LTIAVDLTSAVVAAEQDETLTPADQIDRIAEGKLQAFAGTINLSTGVYLDDVYAQNKSVAEHTAADYHGRFLIELVQNANDVHERGRHDGKIEVLLVEDEGDFGTLYVANFGKPFEKHVSYWNFEDVRSVCSWEVSEREKKIGVFIK